MGDEDCTTTATATPTSSCSVVATLQTANNRVELVSTSGNSVDGFTQQTTYINYTNCEGNSVDFQIKCTSNATIVDNGAGSSITGTFNSFISMTNGSAVTFAWEAVANSSNPTARVRATNQVVFNFRVRFTVGSDNLFFQHQQPLLIPLADCLIYKQITAVVVVVVYNNIFFIGDINGNK